MRPFAEHRRVVSVNEFNVSIVVIKIWRASHRVIDVILSASIPNRRMGICFVKHAIQNTAFSTIIWAHKRNNFLRQIAEVDC